MFIGKFCYTSMIWGRFKSCHAEDSRWWGPLTMAVAGNKFKTIGDWWSPKLDLSEGGSRENSCDFHSHSATTIT